MWLIVTTTFYSTENKYVKSIFESPILFITYSSTKYGILIMKEQMVREMNILDDIKNKLNSEFIEKGESDYLYAQDEIFKDLSIREISENAMIRWNEVKKGKK